MTLSGLTSADILLYRKYSYVDLLYDKNNTIIFKSSYMFYSTIGYIIMSICTVIFLISIFNSTNRYRMCFNSIRKYRFNNK